MEGFSSFEMEEEDEDDNPHNFVDPEMLRRFRKTKSE